MSCQASPARISLETSSAVGSARNNSKGWNASRNMAAYFFAVVSEPPFLQSVGPNAIVGDVGFGVGDNVLDVLSRSQLGSTSEELLRGLSRYNGLR